MSIRTADSEEAKKHFRPREQLCQSHEARTGDLRASTEYMELNEKARTCSLLNNFGFYSGEGSS